MALTDERIVEGWRAWRGTGSLSEYLGVVTHYNQEPRSVYVELLQHGKEAAMAERARVVAGLAPNIDLVDNQRVLRTAKRGKCELPGCRNRRDECGNCNAYMLRYCRTHALISATVCVPCKRKRSCA